VEGVTKEFLAVLPSGYKLCQGTTSVVPQMAIWLPALAAAEWKITENKTAWAKAQHDFVAPSARLKSCPDTSCSLNGILQEGQGIGLSFAA
jgi:hypothetical protein